MIIAGLSFLICDGIAASDNAPASALAFEEVDRIVQSGLSHSDLKEYSRKLRGTRVQWEGDILLVGEENTVYVAMPPGGNAHPNVQFGVPHRVARELQKGETVIYTGTIDQVTVLETLPPMPNTHVVLRDAALQWPFPH